MNLTAKEARRLFKYDPETGVFTRLVRVANCTGIGDVAGHTNSKGYVIIKVRGVAYKAHRMAWLVMTGVWPSLQMDHINGHRNDNRWVNLREVSQIDNSRNCKVQSNSASGDVGVWWHAINKKWTAGIGLDYGTKYLGSFTTKEGAIAARKAAEKRYGFHENHGRAR